MALNKYYGIKFQIKITQNSYIFHENLTAWTHTKPEDFLNKFEIVQWNASYPPASVCKTDSDGHVIDDWLHWLPLTKFAVRYLLSYVPHTTKLTLQRYN